MNSFKIYKSTFKFTLARILTGLAGVALMVGLPVIAFLLSGGTDDDVLRIGICIGAFIVACILVGLFKHFVGYCYRAGQIAVSADIIATGNMPQNAFAEGKAAVKKRFGTVAVFFAIEGIINSIVHQLTSGVSKVADKIGEKTESDTVKAIGTAVSIIINAMLKFMCSCCMGWVFLHPDTNPWRAACDGAIVYFKNWKGLLKNTGKVIGLGVLSLALIGGLLFGASHLALHNQSAIVEMSEELTEFIHENSAELENAVAEGTEESVSEEDTSKAVKFIENLSASDWRLIFEGLIAIILWSILHSSLVDPYIMISVMKRYLTDGLANPPARETDAKLMGMSKSYKKALAKAGE